MSEEWTSAWSKMGCYDNDWDIVRYMRKQRKQFGRPAGKGDHNNCVIRSYHAEVAMQSVCGMEKGSIDTKGDKGSLELSSNQARLSNAGEDHFAMTRLRCQDARYGGGQ